MIMKPYGIRHKKTSPCACEMCGRNDKVTFKRRERQKAKRDIKEALKDNEL